MAKYAGLSFMDDNTLTNRNAELADKVEALHGRQDLFAVLTEQR
jgi:hypothetical protein